ncbi:MAG TPA: N-acyl homoserine lactonase family protein [Alphaproteobacteria bacterium]|nr:N-acyl homoserine lactonase family protein [Alphaproteobacteria bacterium]
MSDDGASYEVYAVKYATMPERTRSTNLMYIDPHNDAPMPIDYYVWAIVGKDRHFVVDTGFVKADADKRGRTLLRDPADGLAMIGIDAAKTEDVIVTHLHYDHIGGYERFPAARFHLQEREMQFATGVHMCTATMNHSFEPRHISGMIDRVFDGRVRFHDGDVQLAPGITLHFVGGHTMGLQVVRVRTRRGWLVLASDASHFYENMEATAPFPIVYNLGDMILGYARCYDLADERANVIPGHDPLVLDRYPAPKKELEGIAVRLDADPK